jgi:hypothetical protein
MDIAVNRDSGLVSPWEYLDFDPEIDEERTLAATPWPLALRREKCKRRCSFPSTSGSSRNSLGMSTVLVLSQ